MITATNCTTYQPEKEENKQYLLAEITPDLVTFSPDNQELRKIINNQIDLYEVILINLLSMKATGLYVSENIQEEIDYTKDILEFLNTITTDNTNTE